MSRHEQKVKQGAEPYLEEGEQVLAALVVRPRGWTQSSAGAAGPGVLARRLGQAKQSQAYAGGEQAGLRLASPMALALTQTRLLTLKIGSPIGLGIGGDVKELVGSAPIEEVDSIEVKRLLLGKVITLTVGGVAIKLEANALADAKGLTEAFNRAKPAT